MSKSASESQQNFTSLSPAPSRATTMFTQEQALDIVISAILEEIDADTCSIFLIHTTSQLTLAASRGISSQSVRSLTIPLNQGLTGKIARTAEPLHLELPQQGEDLLFCEDIDQPHYKTFLGVPIKNQGDVLGVITLQRRECKKFSPKCVSFVEALAIQAANWIALPKGDANHSAPESRTAIVEEKYIEGVSHLPGIAFGTAVVTTSSDALQTEEGSCGTIEQELERLRTAVEHVGQEFREMSEKTELGLGESESVLFEAYAMIAQSDDIKTVSSAGIRRGESAINAVRSAIANYADNFRSLSDDYMRERATDIEHIGRRIIHRLKCLPGTQKSQFPQQTILVGDNLSIYDLMSVPRDQLKALVSTQGSRHSHLAILAKALNIPAVLGLGDKFSAAHLHQKPLIVDGNCGKIYIDPSAKRSTDVVRAIGREVSFKRELKALRNLPAKTKDGFAISLLVNAGMAADVNEAKQTGADGIGLFRTEFPFLSSEYLLTESEQYLIYREILSEAYPNPVVMRTLDIGGDKSLPYWPMEEDNPFLGLRGVRFTLDNQELFLSQIKAMLRARRDFDNLHILLPMVSCLEDIDVCKSLIDRAHEELLSSNVAPVPLGVMIEVPSLLYLFDTIADRVDFFSIGSNDLTQYLLAVDRNNPKVERWHSHFHPAVIKVLCQLVAQAKAHNKPISLCGDLASDSAMVLLLIGMGLNAISLPSADLARIKLLILQVSKTRCEELLQQSLAMNNADAIQALLKGEIKQHGLDKFIRPIK